MDSRSSRRNWRLILMQGLFYALKRRLAPPKVFLPFICVAAGAPVFLAAVVVPLFTISTRSSELLSAPLVSGAQQRKTFAIAGIGGIAAGLLIAIAAIYASLPVLTVVCLVLATVAIGIGRGIGNLAYTAMLPSLLDRESRGHLFNLEGILSACAAMLIALAAYHVFKDKDPLDSHMALAWLALLVAVPAALLLLPLKEPLRNAAKGKTGQKSGTHGLRTALGDFRQCWHNHWFRRYLTAQILLLSVTQAMPFYAIHAASLHKEQPGAYATFVIAMSVGAILSGPVIYRLTGKSVGANLATAIFAAMLAALIALANDLILPNPELLLYLPVLVLVALGAQIATVAMTVYLGEIGSDENREYFVATSRFATGVLGTAVAALLGVLAQMHDEAVPIALLLCTNAIAFVFVLKSLRTETAVR